MPETEKEFVLRRLAIVESNLQKHSQFEVDDKGGFHFTLEDSPMIEYSLIREARILEKLNNEVGEGNIRRALFSWRNLLESELRKHKEKYRPMQDVHDDWMRLPWPQRIYTQEPPQPPDCEVVDGQGHTWLVEKELLDVFDDILDRLGKWLAKS